MINIDEIDTEQDDSKEKIIVARNNEVHGGLSEYIGVEVAIGTLDDDLFANELESLALHEDLLWQRKATGGENFDGSLDYVLTSQFLDSTFKNFNNLCSRINLTRQIFNR